MIYVSFYNFITLFHRLEKLVNLRKVLVEHSGAHLISRIVLGRRFDPVTLSFLP